MSKTKPKPPPVSTEDIGDIMRDIMIDSSCDVLEVSRRLDAFSELFDQLTESKHVHLRHLAGLSDVFSNMARTLYGVYVALDDGSLGRRPAKEVAQ